MVARYLAGEVSVEAAAAEYAQSWIAWRQAGNRGYPPPALGSGLDVDNLSDADTDKIYALMRRVTSIVEDYGINEQAREYLNAAGNSELDQAVRLLAHDVTATLGERHVPVVWSCAAKASTTDRCVEDVQQYFQDTFVDTTWPACPRHPNHPLDYADGSWRCPRDQAVVAQLGQLGETS